MVTVGYLTRYEAKPGQEADVERALKAALATIQKEPATIAVPGGSIREAARVLGGVSKSTAARWISVGRAPESTEDAEVKA